MGKETRLQNALWIGAAQDCQSPVLIRRFHLEEVPSATLEITGLGYFHAKINGRNVTEHRLQPVCSEYGPRDLKKLLYPLNDQLTYRIYYCTYDVTGLLRQGSNALTIQLGNGWYRQTERTAEGHVSYAEQLKAIYCLTLRYPGKEIRICSDGSESWVESPILYNNLFIGEVHDYSRTPGPERPVAVLPAEAAALSPQTGAADKVIRRISPTLLRTCGSRKIYDAGENISAVVRLVAAGNAGERITLRFAENLSCDGELDYTSTGSVYVCASGKQQIQHDVCICSGKRDLFEPLFCWHAFRYFEVEGPGEEPEVLVIHSDVAVTSTFQSDCEGMNFLYDAFLRTQLSNMHGSIPSDCPHRERLGYTGDGQVAAAAAMTALDGRAFYRKWMQDILDTQDRITGHVQHTAPLGGGGGGPVGWGGAIVVVPYQYFKQYGDPTLLEIAWEPILRWIGYIQSRMDNHLIIAEEPCGWCLGDWATREETSIPESYVNTCLFIRYLDMLWETAPVIGKTNCVPAIRHIQRRCREAILSRFYDPESGDFCQGIQGANAYAIAAGVAGAATKQRLIAKYQAYGYFDTGFLGTDILMEVLLGLGEKELAWKLFSSEEMGSFLYMKRHGATTIWEHWDGRESHCHPMFGGCVRHLFEGFLGIRQAYGTGGYANITVNPQLPEKMEFMEGSVLTPRGTLRVSVRRSGSEIRIETEIP